MDRKQPVSSWGSALLWQDFTALVSCFSFCDNTCLSVISGRARLDQVSDSALEWAHGRPSAASRQKLMNMGQMGG